MKFKVMYYNVLHGFHSGGVGEKIILPFQLQPKRLNTAKKLVKRENPDILVLGEACFGVPFSEKSTSNILFIDYKKEFEYSFYYHINTHHEWGISILSKMPFDYVEDYSQYHRTFIKSCFLHNKKRVNLDIVHLHPDLSEEDKQKFLRNCFRDIKHPCILAGDFNAISPDDNYNRDSLITGFSRFMREAAEKKIDDMLKRLALREIKSKGLIDTFVESGRKWGYTIPTNYLSKFKDSGMRIDYIFCSREFKVIDSYIVRNKESEKASDHYPVVAKLNLKE